MAKKQRSARPVVSDADVPVVGLREPCPCGSGRRYKACHGRELAAAGEALVRRPFEGLRGEGDWIAMREIVPSATVALTLAGEHAEALGDRAVTVATVSQVRILRAFGVQRVIVANEIVDEAGLRWIASELAADPAFNLTCWVDSVGSRSRCSPSDSPRPLPAASGRPTCSSRAWQRERSLWQTRMHPRSATCSMWP